MSLPVLGNEIGLSWPIQQPLVVQEALVRSTGGYAGLFDPSQHRIEIAYAAPPAVVLHEAAHAWFNGSLVAGFFMHLISEKKAIYAILLATVFFFAGMMYLTVWSRGEMPTGTRYVGKVSQPNATAAAEAQH